MGTELIRKLIDGEAYGLTSPLILASNGKKFGKSEGNALWLSSDKTSIADMYNYFLNAHDDDISRYLKLLTLYSLEEIEAIIFQHQQNPQIRYGQKKLAAGIMSILYGSQAAAKQISIGSYTKWTQEECRHCIDHKIYPNLQYISSSNIVDILIQLGIETSR